MPTATSGATGDGDGSASFSGDTSISSRDTYDNPVQFSEELWFRTTTTTGGKLISFSDRQSGTSTAYDRHIYMRDDGRLTFGIHLGGGVYTVTSGSAYNDGAWHYVVGTSGSNGIVLYVDGVARGSDPSVQGGEPRPGYWRVGGDGVAGWPNPPTSDYFTGDIDEVAVYPTELSDVTVAAHHAAAGSGYRSTVLADSPDLYWRLDETDFLLGTADTGPHHEPGVAVGRNAGYAEVAGAMRAGQVPTTAVHFTGLAGAWNPVAENDPELFTEECWFRTTTRTGGKILSFGDSDSGNSAGNDRQIYMSDDGTLTFGVWTGGADTISTTSAYNDGAWHHVVGSLGPGGLKLYVDGDLQGAHPGSTQAQPYSGYWRVGGDAFGPGWPNTPSSGYFTGDIGEVAVYPAQLTDEQVRVHAYANH